MSSKKRPPLTGPPKNRDQLDQAQFLLGQVLTLTRAIADLQTPGATTSFDLPSGSVGPFDLDVTTSARLKAFFQDQLTAAQTELATAGITP